MSSMMACSLMCKRTLAGMIALITCLSAVVTCVAGLFSAKAASRSAKAASRSAIAAERSAKSSDEAVEVAKQACKAPYATLICEILNVERLDHITVMIHKAHGDTKNDLSKMDGNVKDAACKLEMYSYNEFGGGIIRSTLSEINMLCGLVLEDHVPTLFVKCIKSKIDTFLSSEMVRLYVEAYGSDFTDLLKVYKTPRQDLFKDDKEESK